MITSAAPSYEEQLTARRRRYALMMSLRIPCVVLAVLFAHIWWLALGLILLSVPLPWMAVLIANDRPPRKAETPQRLRPSRRSLPARDRDA
ncbi:transmembrane protein [Nocardia sp. NRRL S-836]|nr:transmembrane protein [Nocardia sp. NRRL S-836]